jgi:hypothetical protein
MHGTPAVPFVEAAWQERPQMNVVVQCSGEASEVSSCDRVDNGVGPCSRACLSFSFPIQDVPSVVLSSRTVGRVSSSLEGADSFDAGDVIRQVALH